MTIQELLEAFSQQWQRKYKQGYMFEPGRDHKTANQLVRALSPGELKTRIRNYLRHPDPFHADCAHAFSVFGKSINKFVNGANWGATGRDVGGPPSAEETAEYLRKLRRAPDDEQATD